MAVFLGFCNRSNQEFDAKRAAASLNRKFEELGDTLNHLTVAYTPQIRNFDVVRSFQPINDTVLKYSNSAEFRLALQSSLESMRLRLQDINDIPFDSHFSVINSQSHISQIPQTVRTDATNNTVAKSVETAPFPNIELIKKVIQIHCKNAIGTVNNLVY